MSTYTELMETTIPKGRTVRIQDAAGVELTVAAGCLWVTYENDPVDIVLNPSEMLRVSRNGATLIHAMRDTRLRIAYPAFAGPPHIAFNGGYRQFGVSVWRAMLQDALENGRRLIGAQQSARARPAAAR